MTAIRQQFAELGIREDLLSEIIQAALDHYNPKKTKVSDDKSNDSEIQAKHVESKISTIDNAPVISLPSSHVEENNDDPKIALDFCNKIAKYLNCSFEYSEDDATKFISQLIEEIGKNENNILKILGLLETIKNETIDSNLNDSAPEVVAQDQAVKDSKTNEPEEVTLLRKEFTAAQNAFSAKIAIETAIATSNEMGDAKQPTQQSLTTKQRMINAVVEAAERYSNDTRMKTLALIKDRDFENSNLIGFRLELMTSIVKALSAFVIATPKAQAKSQPEDKKSLCIQKIQSLILNIKSINNEYNFNITFPPNLVNIDNEENLKEYLLIQTEGYLKIVVESLEFELKHAKEKASKVKASSPAPSKQQAQAKESPAQQKTAIKVTSKAKSTPNVRVLSAATDTTKAPLAPQATLAAQQTTGQTAAQLLSQTQVGKVAPMSSSDNTNAMVLASLARSEKVSAEIKAVDKTTSLVEQSRLKLAKLDHANTIANSKSGETLADVAQLIESETQAEQKAPIKKEPKPGQPTIDLKPYLAKKAEAETWLEIYCKTMDAKIVRFANLSMLQQAKTMLQKFKSLDLKVENATVAFGRRLQELQQFQNMQVSYLVAVKNCAVDWVLNIYQKNLLDINNLSETKKLSQSNEFLFEITTIDFSREDALSKLSQAINDFVLITQNDYPDGIPFENIIPPYLKNLKHAAIMVATKWIEFNKTINNSDNVTYAEDFLCAIAKIDFDFTNLMRLINSFKVGSRIDFNINDNGQIIISPLEQKRQNAIEFITTRMAFYKEINKLDVVTICQDYIKAWLSLGLNINSADIINNLMKEFKECLGIQNDIKQENSLGLTPFEDKKLAVLNNFMLYKKEAKLLAQNNLQNEKVKSHIGMFYLVLNQCIRQTLAINYKSPEDQASLQFQLTFFNEQIKQWLDKLNSLNANCSPQSFFGEKLAKLKDSKATTKPAQPSISKK